MWWRYISDYSSISKAYHVYNKRTKVIEEFIHVVFDETSDGFTSSSSLDEFQLTKCVDDEDKSALDNSNHQCVPSNRDQCPN